MHRELARHIAAPWGRGEGMAQTLHRVRNDKTAQLRMHIQPPVMKTLLLLWAYRVQAQAQGLAQMLAGRGFGTGPPVQ